MGKPLHRRRLLAVLYLVITLGITSLLDPPISSAQPVASCVINASEPHPLRPYPGEICGPESTRTIEQTDKPYCASRPWAAKDIGYLKNKEWCNFFPEWSDQFPCILGRFDGIFEIDLNQYELPLVSVTRDGSDLTFFNRAQQHLADYLEGRAYYDGVVEPDTDDISERTEIWNRAGVFRKLSSLLPTNVGSVPQNARKITVIESAGSSLHNYIVGYVSGGEPAAWGTGTPMRLSSFVGHYPPDYVGYGCTSITDVDARQACIRGFMEDLEDWRETIYGRLWPNVPMFTREDAIGYVQINPEPLQFFYDVPPFAGTETPMSTQVSIPHLPRLNSVSTMLQQMLSSNLLEEGLDEEFDPFMGTACPAGPWPADFVENPTDYYYNECERGELCNLGDQYYSIGDYVLDQALLFRAKHSIADPPNPKIIPHPYYEEYKDFTCSYNECDDSYPSVDSSLFQEAWNGQESWWCSSAIDDEEAAIRRCPNFQIPYCDINECQTNPSDSPYCETGSIRLCDSDVYRLSGWYECTTGGWDLIYPFPVPVDGWPSGTCYAQLPAVFMQCTDGQEGDPGTGTWVQYSLDQSTPEVGRCENTALDLKAAFTPGYVRTYTPYLRNIWENTVNHTEAIFTLFRTQINKGIYDWPGESFIGYDFPDDYAEAGAPPAVNPGDRAKIYFRYLGFIHCSKENLLQKLAPLLNEDEPYVYYDARCNEELW